MLYRNLSADEFTWLALQYKAELEKKEAQQNAEQQKEQQVSKAEEQKSHQSSKVLEVEGSASGARQ